MSIYEQLYYNKDTNWQEILQIWKKDEVDQAFWQKIYQKFSTWELWREQCLDNDELPSRNWKLYTVHDPVIFAQKAYCGSFDTWFKHYAQGEFPTKEERDQSFLGNIVTTSSLHRNPKILEILHNFPRESQVLGITDGNRIMLYEGHHRCCALVLSAVNDIKVNVDLKIALSEYPLEEFESIFLSKKGNK